MRTYTARNKAKLSTTYSFKVAVINRIGLSPNSTAVEVFTAVVPSVPLRFGHVASDEGSIELEWQAP